MRSSIVYLSLLLQSLLVVPALCTPYHARSVAPARCIVSTGSEKRGEYVKTVPYNHGCPSESVCVYSLTVSFIYISNVRL